MNQKPTLPPPPSSTQGQPLHPAHNIRLLPPKVCEALRSCIMRHPTALPLSAQALLEEITALHRQGLSWRRIDDLRDWQIGTALHDLVCADLVCGHRNHHDHWHLSSRGLIWLHDQGVDVSRPIPAQTKQAALFLGGEP